MIKHWFEICESDVGLHSLKTSSNVWAIGCANQHFREKDMWFLCGLAKLTLSGLPLKVKDFHYICSNNVTINLYEEAPPQL